MLMVVFSLSGCGSGKKKNDIVNKPEEYPEIQQALKSGDSSHINDVDELLRYAYSFGKNLHKQSMDNFELIHEGDSVFYQPAANSAVFQSLGYDGFQPIILGNKNNVILSSILNGNNAKAFAIGTPIFHHLNNGEHAGIENAVKNSVRWLLSDSLKKESVNISIVFHANGFLSSTEAWFNELDFINANVRVCGHDGELDNCLSDSDLIVVLGNSLGNGISTNELNRIESILTRKVNKEKVPYIYTHTGWAHSETSLKLAQIAGVTLPYAGNWFHEEYSDWNNAIDMLDDDPEHFDLFRRFYENDFSIDFSLCVENECFEQESFVKEFLSSAQYFRSLHEKFDSAGIDIFDESDFTMQKLSLLVADKFRAHVELPMDRINTDINDFLKSLYSDISVKYVREFNKKHADLGTFGGNSTANSDLTFVNKMVYLNPPVEKDFHSLGYYVAPGEPFTVKRHDHNENKVYLYINNHFNYTDSYVKKRLFSNNGYSFPMSLRSTNIELTYGEEFTISSPYGGVLYLRFGSNDESDEQITLSLNGVTTYPYLTESTNVYDFESELGSTPWNWVGFNSDYVEIKSDKNLFYETLGNYEFDYDKFYHDTKKYTIESIYNLAGFSGNNLSLNNSVRRFCESRDLVCESESIHKSPRKQHVIVSKEVGCWGCSGNPYRQQWAFHPLGWGEAHEIGHNLQTAWTKIYDQRSIEVSNNIFPLHVGYLKFQEEGIKLHECSNRQESSLARTYQILQDGYNQNDPINYVYEKIWSSDAYAAQAGERLNFYIHLARFADLYSDELNSGWDIFTIMYLYERLIKHHKDDELEWDILRGKIGFNLISLDDLNEITGNDFMLLTMSIITRRDFRKFFDLWGVTYSDISNNQLNTMNYEFAETIFFSDVDYCETLKSEILPIDGTTLWEATKL